MPTPIQIRSVSSTSRQQVQSRQGTPVSTSHPQHTLTVPVLTYAPPQVIPVSETDIHLDNLKDWLADPKTLRAHIHRTHRKLKTETSTFVAQEKDLQKSAVYDSLSTYFYVQILLNISDELSEDDSKELLLEIKYILDDSNFNKSCTAYVRAEYQNNRP